MKKDTFLFGILTALIIPLVMYGVWTIINLILEAMEVRDRFGDTFQFTQKTCVLVAVCTNLIPFHISKNNRWDNMLRAVGLITITMMFGWAFYFGVIEL